MIEIHQENTVEKRNELKMKFCPICMIKMHYYNNKLRSRDEKYILKVYSMGKEKSQVRNGKEFEFLYRERGPEEEPFESIIFMKSKKCDKKNKDSTDFSKVLSNVEKSFHLKKSVGKSNIQNFSFKFTPKSVSKAPLLIKTHEQFSKPISHKFFNKRTHKSKLDLQTEKNEYMFIAGKFVPIDFSQTSTMESNIKIKRKHTLEDIFDKITPPLREIETEVEPEQRKFENINIYEDDPIKEIIIIQRWWRKMLVIKINLKKKEKNEHLNNKKKNKQIKVENKITDSLKIREELLYEHSEIKLKFIKKAFESGKISESLLSSKVKEIKELMNIEMIEITNLRAIFDQHKEKTKQLMQEIEKEKENLEKWEEKDIESIVQSTTNVLISKQANFNDFNQNILCWAKRINDGSLEKSEKSTENEIICRQKSKGCHIDTEPINSLIQENCQSLKGEITEYQTECNEAQDYNYQSDLFEEYKRENFLKDRIDRRINMQLGVQINYSQNFNFLSEEVNSLSNGIKTNVVHIHNFLLQMFKYYTYYNCSDLLREINTPYGCTPCHRLNLLLREKKEQELWQIQMEPILNPCFFDKFYDECYNNIYLNSAQKEMFNYEKIHNKAVFDCFNDCLNFYRPYFHIGGEPFPWVKNEKALTFYYITEKGFQEIFEMTQMKVLRWTSHLCGLHIYTSFEGEALTFKNENETNEILEQNIPSLLTKTREQRLNKSEQIEVKESNHLWEFQENEKAVMLYYISEIFFETLLEELIKEM